MTDLSSLSGGSSGGITGQLDVQWIVEQIIYAKQQPIRELETYEAFYEAKKEAFKVLNTRVSAVESALYTLNNSGFSGKNAAVSSEDYFTATAATTASKIRNFIARFDDFNKQLDMSADVKSLIINLEV